MRLRAGQILVATCLLALILATMPAVHAFDASVDTNTSLSNNLNPQQLQSLLTQLNQESSNSQLSNNSQFEQLLSQFNSSLTSNNANLTASSLSQLQSLLSSLNSTSLFSNLIQSLQPSGNGVTINPAELSSLLNLGRGLPSGVNQSNAAQEITGLSSLASLVQGFNPQLAAELLHAASNLSIKFGINGASLPFNSLGSLSSLKGLKSPSIGAPNLGASSSPRIQLETLLVPIIIVAAFLTLFALRGKLAELLRGQNIPGVQEEEDRLMKYDPNDPKKRILYYFTKAVQFMKRRGITKSSSDTSREFTEKCHTSSGSEHVGNLGNLYEKAQFSGRLVTNDDADLAQKELSSLEDSVEAKSS